ncbi:MAG: Ig-like domain-containing protein [Bacteroidales bacterium]|nr:Ig-like domain-containing protein [Bacteroidales bacterium]
MDANGGNAIVGKFVVKTKAFKGLPEITGVVSQSADAKIGAWSGQYPCFTRTIAQIEGEYAKYVNAKCKIVNVEVTKAFGQTKTGEIKDASGSLAIYNYSTDLTEDVPVGAKAEYAIVWPTVYNTHQLGFYKASQLKLTSCPGVVTVAATKSIAAGETFELGATTNSTGALSYASSDEAVATVSDAGLVTAVAAGTATITVSVAADGIYTAGSAECVVTVTAGAVATVLYSRVGAETPASWAGTYLMVYAKNGPQVLSSISDTSTKYGVGSRVTINEDATITQTDELKACEVTIAAASDGNADHYVMMFNGKYLTWTSGNSLNVADAESDNTRWTLAVGTAATGNVIITNVADSARQLWYNESSPRFACYTGKTETTSNYAPAQLFKLME